MVNFLGLLGYALVPVGIAVIWPPVTVGVAILVAGIELAYLSYINQPGPKT